jgi:cephalosporin-C deacetylase-like acetyl esterase
MRSAKWSTASDILSLCVVLALPAPAAPQQNPADATAKATAETREFLQRTTRRLADSALADIGTLDDWQRRRPVLREQLLEMLGLSPLPERTDLKATVTGTIEQPDFVVEKLHFQSRPGLYVTANFYRPKVVEKPLPTILYLCGHGNVKIDGVSYGSKASYQHHPAWFAREGYCCLILDTLQLGEIEGLHHGTYREGMWWWLARGYTPAGVEAWNAVRALDYLETRPEVDMKRIGVTGRSGGGAYTWWLAAIDDRPACLIPVAGITDLENHVVDGCIEGHCDCMYMVNTYGWDFATVAALAAPRPLLFSNSDKDTIFPLTGVVRTHAKLKKIYDLYKASDKLGLLITEGPHKDTQELQVPAFRWMNRWLQGKDEPITRVADKPLDPKQLKVFDTLPSDEKNTSVHEWFVAAAPSSAVPASRAEWESWRSQRLTELKAESFRGWPDNPPPLDVRLAADARSGAARIRVFEFTSEEDLRVALIVLDGPKASADSDVRVIVPDDEALNSWAASLDPALARVLPIRVDVPSGRSQEKSASLSGTTEVRVLVRGVGPHRWNQGKKEDTHIRRRFALLGRTPADGQVWDLRRALEALDAIDDLKDKRVRLEANGEQAGTALYAAILTPTVAEVLMDSPPSSHREGCTLLNVLRVVDLPQAVTLIFPRRVTIRDSDPEAWRWSESVAKLVGRNDSPLRFSNSGGR